VWCVGWNYRFRYRAFSFELSAFRFSPSALRSSLCALCSVLFAASIPKGGPWSLKSTSVARSSCGGAGLRSVGRKRIVIIGCRGLGLKPGSGPGKQAESAHRSGRYSDAVKNLDKHSYVRLGSLPLAIAGGNKARTTGKLVVRKILSNRGGL